MGYINSHHDLGAEIVITGNAAALTIAKLQLAINRIILGGRTDANIFAREIAKQASQVKESGVLGTRTNASYASARQISGVLDPVTLTTIAQIEEATRALNTVADQRGYPSPDTIRLKPGIIQSGFSLFGGGDQSKEGPPIVPIVIGAAALGLGFWLLRKRGA